MGAAESKASANGSEGSSRDKLTFVQGAAPLLATPVYTLRPAFFGKRPVAAFTYDPAQFALNNKQEFLPKAIKVQKRSVAGDWKRGFAFYYKQKIQKQTCDD
jgi:hypothetical protein